MKTGVLKRPIIGWEFVTFGIEQLKNPCSFPRNGGKSEKDFRIRNYKERLVSNMMSCSGISINVTLRTIHGCGVESYRSVKFGLYNQKLFMYRKRKLSSFNSFRAFFISGAILHVINLKSQTFIFAHAVICQQTKIVGKGPKKQEFSNVVCCEFRKHIYMISYYSRVHLILFHTHFHTSIHKSFSYMNCFFLNPNILDPPNHVT